MGAGLHPTGNHCLRVINSSSIMDLMIHNAARAGPPIIVGSHRNLFQAADGDLSDVGQCLRRSTAARRKLDGQKNGPYKFCAR